jgi:chromosome partitioning protein
VVASIEEHDAAATRLDHNAKTDRLIKSEQHHFDCMPLKFLFASGEHVCFNSSMAKESKQQTEYMCSVGDVSSLWGITSPGASQFLKLHGHQLKYEGRKAYVPQLALRDSNLHRGLIYSQKTISVQMLKGGVGKTTTVLNLGIRASMLGSRVLLIDLDQQANLTSSLALDDLESKTWLDLLTSNTNIKDIIQPVSETLHAIPSTLNNSLLDKEFSSPKKNIKNSISSHLDKIKQNYDLIIIDAAPGLSAVNISTTCASDLVIVPINPDRYSYNGLHKMINELNEIKNNFLLNFDTKILVTKFDARETSISHEILRDCSIEFSTMIFPQMIRTCSELKKNTEHPTNTFSNKSAAKEDYDMLTQMIIFGQREVNANVA